MLNRLANAAKTWVVVGVGALVLGLAAFFILSNPSPDSVLAHPHDPVVMHPGVADDAEHIHYDENDDGPVRVFMSTDPETGDTVHWDVTGTDGDDFMIMPNGALMFKQSPDFEKPMDYSLDANDDGDFEDANDTAPDNVYQVMVRATEKTTPGDEMGRALSTEIMVTVVVNNVDEDGTVELNYLQPEVGTEITAMLMDEDIEDPDTVTVTWEWSVSKVTGPDKDTEDHWTIITGDTDAMFTPRGDRDNDITLTGGETDPNRVIDEGEIIRAKATYTDTTGTDKVAIGVSMYPVRAEVDSDNDGVENASNGSPGFPDGLDYTRSIPESTAMEMNVGAAVEAEDPNDDMLSYMLMAAAEPNDDDITFFNIDRATGQISLKKMLDYEAEDDRDYTDPTPNATAGEYKVIVVATDPSGESAQVTVTITATDANDDPMIRGREELQVMEQDSDDRDGDDTPDKTYTGLPDMNVNQASTNGDNANIYRASDDDERGQVEWDFKMDANDPEAEDYALFELSDTSLSGPDEPIAIRFIDPPDYESPGDANRDNVYKVTLVATDGVRRGGRDEFRLSIFVGNEHEQGEAALMASGDDPTQPVIGEMMTAMVNDPDGGIAIVTWQWQRSGTKDGTYEPIPGATSDTYTPNESSPTGVEDDPGTTDTDESMTSDVGKFLRAVATYIDTTSDEDVPEAEGTDPFDNRVQTSATDAEDPTMGDGDNVTSTGEETDSAVRVYRVMATTDRAVRAPDTGPGTTAPEPMTTAPTFDPGSYTGTVYENSEVGSLVTMSAMVSAGMDQAVMLDPLDSEDNKYFMIDEMTGQIRVGEVPFRDPLPTGVEAVPDTVTPPGMEDPDLDYETRTTYRLVVSATNSAGKSTANVTISLMDRNEHPYFDEASRNLEDAARMFDEDSTNRTVTGLAATEPDGDTLHWEVVGTDSADFEIVQAPDGADGKDRVELRFKEDARHDYERPMDRDEDATSDSAADDDDNTQNDADEGYRDNMYKVTVRATEAATVGSNVPPKAAELDLTVEVTPVDEDGMVHIQWLRPEVGTAITASLTDPDNVADDNADGDVATGVDYKWFRAKVRNPDRNVTMVPNEGNSEWEPITGGDAETATYTPQGATPDDPDTTGTDESMGTAMDEDWHLLARAMYGLSDEFTAIGISEYPVRADVHDNANNSPDFTAAKTTRRIAENAAVGAVVTLPVESGGPSGAVDVDRNEDGDVLTYELVSSSDSSGNTGGPDDGNSDVDTNDLGFFYIDRDTGQIRVKKPLNFEGHDLPTPEIEPSEYTLVVRATDPSGEGTDAGSTGDDEEENRDDITVVITVTDVEEAPKVTDGYSVIQVNEMNESKKMSDGGHYYIGLGNIADLTVDAGTITTNANNQNYYKVSDEDLVDSHRWPESPKIPGPDGEWFEYSTPDDGISRRVHFIDPPNYEDPKDENGDNVYEVCVTAVDNSNLSGCKMVRIEVLNVQEDGMLVLEPAEPVEATADAGVEITATLTDPDGEVVITDWKWVATQSRLSAFPGDDTTPADGVIDALVESETRGETMNMYTGMAGNFVWAMVDYRDGASVVDDPVTALDERNDNPGSDGLLGTPDDGDTEHHKFQNLTDADPPVLDTGDDSFHNSDEMLSKVTDSAVQAPATDPPGPGPGDETGDPTGPPSVLDIERMVPENTPSTGYVGIPLGMDVYLDAGDMVRTITGPDANVFVFAENEDESNDGYYDDELAPSPDIEGDKGGQLALVSVNHLDFEASKNSYTIEFSDEAADSNVYRVTIVVTDVNEAPSMPEEARGGININGPLNINRYEEGSMAVVATYSTTGGDAGATVMWSLDGDDMDDLSIDANGMLTFDMTPDYEDPTDDNGDNIYTVTVEAIDGANVDSQFVAVTVVNVDEMGVATLWADATTALTMPPQVGDTITGAVMDPDGNPNDTLPIAMDTTITDVMWQWSMSDMMEGTYHDIAGATDAAYMVMDADAEMYLKATAMYEDGHGPGKDAYVMTMMVGGAEPPPMDIVDQYAGEDGMVDRSEAVQAVLDYLIHRTISRDDAVAVVTAYLFPGS